MLACRLILGCWEYEEWGMQLLDDGGKGDFIDAFLYLQQYHLFIRASNRKLCVTRSKVVSSQSAAHSCAP